MASINKEEAKSSNSGSLLPRLFALKCNSGKYMRCESEGDVGLLTFSVEGILYEPRTRFEVEPTSIPGVVHIRCTFNNKYLRRDSKSSEWIRVLATKKSEDRARWDCTMFEVLPAKQGDGLIQLRHVQLGYYLIPITGFGLKAASATPTGYGSNDKYYNFTFIDWSTLVTLPRYVAFKGSNGKYLKKGDADLLAFISDDKGDAGVTMEVVPAKDGNIHIKAGPGQKTEHWALWKYYSGDCIQMSGKDPIAMFQAVKDEVNKISFRHLDSNKFCSATGLYSPDTSSITKNTKLVVEEAVMRRTLEIQWRLQDARVYNVVPYELNCSTHDNNSSSAVTKLVTLTYETAVTTSFETSHTWAAGIRTTIETPSIPFIGVGMKIEMSAQYGGSYTWGETTTNTRRFSETDNFTIPPRTRLVVQKLSTKGYCDVPYKYVQTDYLLNGDVIRTDKEDGVYKGINYFNIHTSNSEEPLPGSLLRAVPKIFVGQPLNLFLKLKEPLIFLLLAWLCVVIMERFSKNSSS